MPRKTPIGLAAVTAAVVAAVAVPTAHSQQQDGQQPSGQSQPYRIFGGQDVDFRRGDVPSRVRSKLRRAERALDRAGDAADDANTTGATSALSAARRDVAAAAKTAARAIGSDADSAPATLAAVDVVEHDIVGEAAGLYDGQDGDLVTAITSTLGASLDGRDALLSAATAQTAGDADYGDAYDMAARDLSDEADAISGALSDDDLTDAAKAALTSAQTHVAATQKVVDGLTSDASADDGSDDSADDSSGDSSGDDAGKPSNCPPASAQGGRQGSGSAQQQGSGAAQQSGSGAAQQSGSGQQPSGPGGQ